MAEITEAGVAVVDKVRQEADAYRGAESRPMAGYVASMALYCLVVSVATVAARVTGRGLPKRWHPQDLVLVTIGTHKLSRTIAKDAVTSPLRAPFTRYQGAAGPAEVKEEARHDSTFRHTMGELLTCPFCLDMWVATGFAFGLVFAPRFTRLMAGTFTALAGADFLQLGYAAAQQRAESS